MGLNSSMIPTPTFQFKQATHYVFFYEDTQILLLVWERDYTKALYIVLEQKEDGTYVIDYPGSLFSERLIELIDSFFFIQVQEQDVTMRYVLGAYYQEGETWYGAYYPRSDEGSNQTSSEIVFFKILDQAGTYTLQELDTHEHQKATDAFLQRYQDILNISL